MDQEHNGGSPMHSHEAELTSSISCQYGIYGINIGIYDTYRELLAQSVNNKADHKPIRTSEL